MYSPAPALPEHKSIVSGRVLDMRVTTLPLTIDSESSETPIYGVFTDDRAVGK